MPNSKKQWIVNLSSEFIGTIFLTWMIALLGISFNGNLFEKMISFTTHSDSGSQWEGVSNLVIGFWVAMDVAICITIFARWSCDLNFAVTLFRIISKQNSIKYGLAKLGVQVLAGFAVAGLIIGTQALSHAVSGNAIDALKSYSYTDASGIHVTSDYLLAQSKSDAYALAIGKPQMIINSNHTWSAFLDSTSSATAAPGTFTRHLFALIGETCGVLMLIFPIFSKTIKTHVLRHVFIVLIVGFGVAALFELKTVGWNPARSLATTFAYDIINPGMHATKLYWAYFIGPILAVLILFGLQKFNVHDFANHLWSKWLSIGSLGEIKSVELDKHKKRFWVKYDKPIKENNS